jgi:uncharacterized protein YggE
MKLRVILSLALFCAFLAPLAARAQQAAGASAYPTGVTVVATGTAEVTEWVEQIDLRFSPPAASADAYGACAAAVGKLNDAVRDAGQPSSAIVTSAVEYTSLMGGSPAPIALARLRLSPADLSRVLAATGKAGWKTSGTPELDPRDPAAAADAAYRKALSIARARAEAIAAADGRHVGRLLNVQPSPADYLSSMMAGFVNLAQRFGQGETQSVPTVSQTGTFTFELTP